MSAYKFDALEEIKLVIGLQRGPTNEIAVDYNTDHYPFRRKDDIHRTLGILKEITLVVAKSEYDPSLNMLNAVREARNQYELDGLQREIKNLYQSVLREFAEYARMPERALRPLVQSASTFKNEYAARHADPIRKSDAEVTTMMLRALGITCAGSALEV